MRRLERQRDYAAALKYARRLWRRDPVRDETYQRLVHLYVLSGDRASALQAPGALAFFVSRGWTIPLFVERWSTSEGKRTQQRANLAWFAEQVRAVVQWL